MRCNYNRCGYNEDGYCRTPDYVAISEKGVCNQMWVRSLTVTEKYQQLKTDADEAYRTFDANPNQVTSDTYGMALNRLRDFCVDVISIMVEQHPEISNKIMWEED